MSILFIGSDKNEGNFFRLKHPLASIKYWIEGTQKLVKDER